MTVMRVDQARGSAVRLKLSLDGRPFAWLGAGDSMEIRVPPGERFLLVGEENWGEVQVFEARPGAREYFRINIPDNDTISFQRLLAADGKRELASGNYRRLEATSGAETPR